MAELAIIRIGDPTSHGGVVLEGFSTLNIYGKNAAGVGHRGQCPMCKTTFTIVAGASNYTYMGNDVALEGMLTSCGATLIATQRQATVEVELVTSIGRANDKAVQISATSNMMHTPSHVYDEQFLIKCAAGMPLAGIYYTAKLSSGELIHGETDDAGKTQRFTTEMAGKVDIYLGHREKV